jgi:hypothetical protein
MSALPSHVIGRRETTLAKEAARQENAERVWSEVDAERRAVEDRTAKLRAMRLARERTGS